jgi:hypothetical protein
LQGLEIEKSVSQQKPWVFVSGELLRQAVESLEIF